MWTLTYVSRAVKLMDEAQLLSLLTTSRAKNSSLSITGMLLYHDGAFIQNLEGEQSAVLDLYKTIEQDERHQHCVLLMSDPLEQRCFPEWSMGFRNLASVPAHSLAGYSNFLKCPEKAYAAHPPNLAYKLLLKFRSVH